ncbi:MAG: aldolase catalytic domain-containing protein [Verrucomicrobiales bacterium]|nr:aldolase catalytic domain-containing protein [Verrucomicrobiales bacterium]
MPTKTKEPKESEPTSTHRWLSYRPEIKVLDCTIRDGGLMNNHHFDDAIVKVVYDTCVAAGIDYMELGYKASRKGIKQGEHGCWKYCQEEDIRRIVGDNPSSLKLTVMADAERCDYHEDIPPKKDSVVDMIRVATYITQIPTALDMVKDAHDKGYETTLNLMAASIVPDRELDEGLEMMAKSEAKAIYVVDSFGALYSEQVHYLVRKYLDHCKASGKEVGVHMHNNMQLAYANTLEGIIEGANFVDATMAGLGRGAGNCPMELILAFLRNPKFNLRPVLDCVQNHIEPMRAKLLWGYDLPYLLTGMLNQHPRAAIRFKEAELKGAKGDILAFYDSATAEE